MIIIKTILYIIAFVVVLAGSYYFSRFISSRQNGIHKSKYMKVEDKLILTKDNTLEIIKVGGSYLLLGITGNSVSVLREVNENDLQKDETTSFGGEIKMFESLVKNIKKRLTDIVQSLRSHKIKTEFREILKEIQNTDSKHPEDNTNEN